MPFNKIYIPKNKKKIKKNFFDVKKINIFEKKIFDLYNNGKIKYPIHLTKGNENQLVEIFKYIDQKDWVFTSWRNHAHALLHGIPEKKLEKQIMTGKSMYVSSKKNNFFCSSIAGGIIPIALGSALALKRKGSKQKVWLFVGDMTSMMGVFYEAYNYSRNFNLPLEIVIEDNGQSVYTDTKKTWNIKKLQIPKDIFYYKFKLGYPHHGTGQWVSF
ncbi:thiamine pyrophosphate-dependent enzyme [Candidatus Pelagibacter sp.]|nr:thiamine pyrophosphate-dependent enzyme [Candidatus Pelagibacter sp.]